MAHTCPECGLICHCNGDMGDLLFEFSEQAFYCTHCRDEDDDDEWLDLDREEEHF